jgi:hypothetical protein
VKIQENEARATKRRLVGMSMLPVFKRCLKCKRKYSWNPDVGKMWCPYCGPLSLPGLGDVPGVRNNSKRK